MGNETTNIYGEQTPIVKSTTTEMMVSKEAQQVQVAMLAAKKFPRDEIEAYNRIMRSCRRKSLAEQSMYEYPRGVTKVTGPSIRLAEAVAQNWGNMEFGIKVIEQKNSSSTVEAFAWDLETNTKRSMIFEVKHERKAKGKITKLDDPRDIYEMVANQGARRVRACILAVIPGDVIESAVDECKKTLVSGNKEPLIDRVRKMVGIFEKDFSVTKEMLESYLGCNSDAFSENDFIRLRNVYKSLRAGMSKREDYFEIKGAKKESEPVPTKLDNKFKKNNKDNSSELTDEEKAEIEKIERESAE